MGISGRNWQEVALGNECVIERGISWKREQETTVSDTAWPVLTIPNIKEQLDVSDVTYITGVSEKVAGRTSATVGYTILIGSNGNKERVGDCCYIAKPIKALYASFLMGITPKPHSKLESRFLYYLMKSQIFRNRIHGSLIGTTSLSNLRLSFLREQIFRVPPLPTQRKIAAILSAYDDLVENNIRRIKILEEMAQNLYREWFVKFCFPGHQHSRFLDSPNGRIPQGWEVKTLGSLIVEHIGGGWGKDVEDDKHPEQAWVIRGTDIPDARSCRFSRVPLRYHKKSNLKSRRLIPGDIIFEVSGGSKDQPVGRSLYVSSELLTEFNGNPVICASFCKRIRPDSMRYASEILYLSFLDAYISGEIEQYQVQSTGISNYKWSDYIEKASRCVPPISLQERFREWIVPLFSEVAALGRKNTILRRTRDLLLSKLISGEVDVSALDIALPEEASA